MNLRLRDSATVARIDSASDLRLERDINRAKMQFMFAQSIHERTQWLRTMEALIDRRSPEQIAKMERQKGLV
jgi:acyl-CoA reductase-like NAD-dependent aldehyde dehydrogenase